MRISAALLIALVCAGGCEHRYLLTRGSADALAAPARTVTAVPAVEGERPVWVSADRLVLDSDKPAPPGTVRAHSTPRASHPRLMIAGAVTLVAGVLLVAAGGGVAGSPVHCTSGEEFCGFGQAILGVTIMGLGGAVGLVGLVLTAVGGADRSPEVR